MSRRRHFMELWIEPWKSQHVVGIEVYAGEKDVFDLISGKTPKTC